MALIWPVTLPTRPMIDGFQTQEANVLLRTDMETGPPKVRRRFTAGYRRLTASYVLNKDQLGYFRTFYVTDTLSGALPFEWTDPTVDATVSARFAEPPVEIPIGGKVWRVNMLLEILP